MTEAVQQQDFGPRVKDIKVVKPIVYGNIARYFGAPRDDGHTHEWTVFLRSADNEDISGYIKRVHFKLHESYANPNRILTEPPYQVTESGWGEFEIVIKIYFHDPNERPVTIYHLLKLFKQHPIVTDYLVTEYYDELIFSDPTQLMYEKLQAAKRLPFSQYEPFDTDFQERRKSHLAQILAAKSKISIEIEELRRRIDNTKDAIVKQTEKINEIEHQNAKNEGKVS